MDGWFGRFSAITALLLLAGAVLLAGCGETQGSGRSAATGSEQLTGKILTEADAGASVIETPYFVHDIGLPDKRGLEIELTGDDASALRWRFAQKPDQFILEWHAVDGVPAFETGDLIGDPASATKVLEFRGTAGGDTTLILELVEMDPANRGPEPAKRLEYTFRVTTTGTQCDPAHGCPPLSRALAV